MKFLNPLTPSLYQPHLGRMGGHACYELAFDEAPLYAWLLSHAKL